MTDTQPLPEKIPQNNKQAEEPNNPLHVSVSEAAKLGGVGTKTIRRAIQFNKIKYKVKGNRYSIDLSSVIDYLFTKTKLKNKLNQFGLGQYVEKWRK